MNPLDEGLQLFGGELIAAVGEPIIYKPHQKKERRISGIVTRNRPQWDEETHRGQIDYTIHVLNHPVDGISVDDWNKYDVVEIAEESGGTKKITLTLNAVLGSDGGFVDYQLSA